MPRTLALALALAAAPMLPTSARAEAPVEGRVETDTGRIEILGRRVRVGEKIELPEGWLRVEEAGPEDGEVGSFGIVSAETFGSAGAQGVALAPAGAPADSAPGGAGCRGERSAYLAELWRSSGIDVKDPSALLEGLQGGATGPGTGFYWFALATDAFRPLAWSSELRARADALARCVRGQGG
jgi:hypothetical protein